jgi:hypothetical protein
MTKYLAKFVVWGNPGTVFFTGLAVADIKLKGMSMADNVRVADAEDGQGYVFASNVKRTSHVLTLTFVPFDSSAPGSLATAKSNVKVPDPGAVVTLAGLGNTMLDGDWNYIGGATVTYSDNDEQTVIVSGVQLRRVATVSTAPAAQTVLP